MFKKVCLVMVLVFLLETASGYAKVKSVYEPIRLGGVQEKVYLEIRPEIELLAGVLSQTSWFKAQGPQGVGNQYYRELQAFFGKYKDHPAIKTAERLTQADFNYDAPPNFILSLGPLPNMKPLNGYSHELQKRAGGIKNLNTFRRQLVQLAKQSNFAEFYRQHRPYLQEILVSATKGYDGLKVRQWLQKFFGLQGDEYYLFLVPAMFSGGYGGHIDLRNERKIIYLLALEDGRSEGKPEFYRGKDLEMLSIHEWSHPFVNPAIDQYPEALNKLQDLYNPVKEIMQQDGYLLNDFFHEQVIRSIECLAYESLYDPSFTSKFIDGERRWGFYLTDFTVAQLRYYQKNRDKYPTFNDFVPYLLKSYQENMDELLKTQGKQWLVTN